MRAMRALGGAALGAALLTAILFAIVSYSLRNAGPDELPLNGLVVLHLGALVLGAVVGGLAGWSGVRRR